MDLGKLRTFIVVAEQLNFRRSAEILGMSQPPLTRLIASLEEELDVTLFERTTRKVKLTGAGVLLLKEARQLISNAERIEAEVRAAGRMKAGVLRVGFSRTVFMARFPDLIDAFERRFSRIKVELQEIPSTDVLRKLKQDRFDLGFVESVTEDRDLARHEIDHEPLGVLLPERHRLSKRKEVLFQDLKDETFILHHKREADEFHNRTAHLVRSLTKKPKVYIKAEGESCPILVATGKGVSLMIAGANGLAPRQTRFVPIREMFLPISVFWKDTNTNPSLKSFLSFAVEKKSVLSKSSQCLSLSAGF